MSETKICPKCGSTNTHDHWFNPDDHGLIIYHNWRCHDCGWDDSKTGKFSQETAKNMYEALDYCVKYCDEHDDCGDCAFRDIRIDKTTECPIYVITTLKDCVEREILQKGEQIDWSQVKF